MFRKVEVWFVLLLSILFFIGLIFYGALLRSELLGKNKFPKSQKAALFIAEIPSNIKSILDISKVNESYIRLSKDEVELKYINEYKKDYLLISAYDHIEKTSTVRLYNLETDEFVYKWIPDISEIKKLVTKDNYGIIEPKVFRSQHPILTEDGGVIFTSGEGPLVKLDICSNISWINNRHFHHSIEKSSSNTLFVPTKYRDTSEYIGSYLGGDANKDIIFRDDGFAEINLESGKIIKEYSVTKILMDNGYSNIVFQGLSSKKDFVHLNDADPIVKSDEYVKQGDIMLSSRYLAMVALYRPSTNKIIWLKQGPWSQQHDVDYQGNGEFTIFGNDSSINGRLRKYTTIYTYDMKTDKTSELMNLRRHKIVQRSEGLHTMLSNKNIFMDNGDFLRILDSDQNHVFRMSLPIKDNYISALHWSRYIPNSEEIENIVKNIENRTCIN